jgi:hypothetical protein
MRNGDIRALGDGWISCRTSGLTPVHEQVDGELGEDGAPGCRPCRARVLVTGHRDGAGE